MTTPDIEKLKLMAAVSQIKKDMKKSSDCWFVTHKAHVEYLIQAAQAYAAIIREKTK